jgi:hypothetical protein
MLTVGIILIGFVAAAAFMFAVFRLFSPGTRELGEGDISGATYFDSHHGDHGGGDHGGGH